MVVVDICLIKFKMAAFSKRSLAIRVGAFLVLTRISYLR